MIHLIVGVTVGITVLGIIKSLQNEAGQSRARWESSYQSLVKTIEEHEENIKQHIDRINESCSFHELTDLHYSSFKVADEAYRLKRDAEHSIKTQFKAINQIKSEIDRLFVTKRDSKNKDEKATIQREIEETLDLKKQLYSDLSTLKEQYNDYIVKVKHFNHITSNLKDAIRERCGQRGRDWYDQLQARIYEKRNH